MLILIQKYDDPDPYETVSARADVWMREQYDGSFVPVKSRFGVEQTRIVVTDTLEPKESK